MGDARRVQPLHRAPGRVGGDVVEPVARERRGALAVDAQYERLVGAFGATGGHDLPDGDPMRRREQCGEGLALEAGRANLREGSAAVAIHEPSPQALDATTLGRVAAAHLDQKGRAAQVPRLDQHQAVEQAPLSDDLGHAHSE